MKAQLESLSQEQLFMSVLEKLKALDAQRAQLLEGAKKEALDNAEKAVAELNELGFHYSLVEGASTARAHAKLPLKPQSAKREICPARYASSRQPHFMMGECIGRRRLRSNLLSRNLWKGV
jgi:hypothetical protein